MKSKILETNSCIACNFYTCDIECKSILCYSCSCYLPEIWYKQFFYAFCSVKNRNQTVSRKQWIKRIKFLFKLKSKTTLNDFCKIKSIFNAYFPLDFENSLINSFDEVETNSPVIFNEIYQDKLNEYQKEISEKIRLYLII